MSGDGCSQFVLHAWKADICANCLRSRSNHMADAETAAAADVSIPAQTEHHCSTTSPAKHDSAHNSESPRSSNFAAAKPSPVKAKPIISAKPAKSKKPNLVGGQTSVKSDISQCDEHISAERSASSESKITVTSDRSSVQLTAEKLSSLAAAEFLHTADTCIENEKQMCANEKMFHHYEVYDVSARGLSGTPRDVELGNKTASSGPKVLKAEHGKFQTLPLGVTEVAEEHVAMPYNVVDVTLPRQFSLSDSATLPASSWPNRPQPAKRQAISKSPPKPQERVTITNSQTVSSSNIGVADHQESEGCSEASATISRMAQSDLVSDRYAHRIYEDIDDLRVDHFSSKTNAHSSITKSPAFEAKMAALALLEFKKTSEPVTTVALAANPPEETVSLQSDIILLAQDSAVVPTTKTEKTRKNGGKTFLQKFFKFGSKETVETAQTCTTGSSDEASLKVVQCQDSLSPGKGISDDGKLSPDAVLPQAAPLNEKRAMLMNLKDCLAKRQTSAVSSSVENSPDHSRTRSLEPTPLQISVQSTSSLHENSEEKDDKHNSVLQETLPPMKSHFDSRSIHDQQPVSTSGLTSVPPEAPKELAEIDRSLRIVDMKSVEMQRLEVKDLTIVTEDAAANAECSVSTCSSDAVSPTPSDLSVEGSDHHSLKRKSRTDRQVRRRMLEAPPPPPAVAAASVVPPQDAGNSAVLTSPRLSSGTIDVVSVQHRVNIITRHVSVPCDGSKLTSIEVPFSRSLPRPAPKTAQLFTDKKLSSDDVVLIPSTAGQRDGGKVISEVDQPDAEQWNEGIMDYGTDEDRMNELSEKRASKFFNRALPDPPIPQSSASQHNSNGGSVQNSGEASYLSDELNNLYELISQSTLEHDAPSRVGILGTFGVVGNSGETYEDIDDCLERSNLVAATSINDSSSSRSSSIQRATRNNLLPDDEEYLEPIIPPEEEILQNNTSSWRPSPAPRYSLSATMSYVNTDMMSPTMVPSLADGFTAVTNICRDALKQIAERLSAQYMTASWPASVHLDWADFELCGGDDGEPHLTQQHVCYYRARHASLAPKGCVLMVFKMWPQRALTSHQHPNVLSPLATFCAPHLSTGTSTNNNVDNVVVLPSASVIDFRQYWHDQWHNTSRNSECLVEQSACLTLARLLSAALYLYEHCGLEMPRLLTRHVVMTVLDTGECYPLLRPSTRALGNFSKTFPGGTVADDVSELVSIMLQLDCVPGHQSNSSVKRGEKPTTCGDVAPVISPTSSYLRCLQHVVRFLHRKAGDGGSLVEGMKKARQLLDFTVWGPPVEDKEARLMAVSDDDQDTALRVWLAVTRCQLLAELAVADDGMSQNGGLEVAEKAAFLSSATEKRLFELTKLLVIP